MTYTYVASPYSHPSASVRAMRFVQVQEFCVWALSHHKIVFSPIMHWHSAQVTFNLARFDYEFFKAQNDAMLDAAESVLILKLPGWDESKGIKHEIERAMASKPIYAAMPTTIDGKDSYIITNIYNSHLATSLS